MELYSGMGGTNVRTQWEEYSGLFNKMTAEQEKAVVKFVKEHFVTSTKVVINWIKEHWGIVYSEQGMKNFLNRHGFVYKKPKGIPGKTSQCRRTKGSYTRINLYYGRMCCP